MVMLYIISMHISCFVANDLLLTIYFIFILNLGNYARQKVNSSNFLIQVRKAAKTTHNINSPFGPGTTGGHTMPAVVQEVLQRKMRALKMRSTVAGHRKLTSTNLEDHRS